MEKSNSNVKQKTFSNLVWRFAERCGAQAVSFVVSIVLARLLDPEVYGTIAIVTIFTTILNVFVDSGLGTALIQKKDADDLDFSTVFYANIVFCLILYALIFTAAPFIASFYGESILTPVIRVLSLTVVISGIKNVQIAYVSKHLMFKKFFWSTLGGTIGAAVFGIYMAYTGYGVWALVAQQVFNTLVDTVILWITVKWRPKWMFSFHIFKALFSYGWKLLVSSLINTVYNDIRQLIIGKVYSSSDLAYYNRGKQFPNLIVANINSSIDSVLLPIMSESQDNKARVKDMTRRAISISSYIMWPLMFGLMAVGEPIIKILLTDKWLPSFPYLCVFCFVCGLMPIQTANLNAINAMGRSDLYLKMEIIKKSVGLLLVLLSMNISVLAMALSSVVYSVFTSVVNSFPNKKLLGYSYFDQIKDILPSMTLALVMAVVVYLIPNIINIYVTLVIKVTVGVIIYIAGSVIFKNKNFAYLKDLLMNFLKHR